MYYLMLILAALLLALDFSLNKLYQKKVGTSPAAGFAFNALLGLACGVIFFAVGGFKLTVTPYSLVMATAMAVLVVGYNLIGFRIMKRGSVAVYTLFLMTGGMTVPYVWGILFLDEELVLVRTLGVVLIIAAVALSNLSREKIDGVQLAMCAAVFVLNGFTSVTSKLHQIEDVFATADMASFVVLAGLCKFVFSGIAYFAVRKKSGGEMPSVLPLLPIILGSAAISGASYYLQLIGASNLSATVLYPILTGGTMILSSIAGVVFFKDKLSKNLMIGIGICFIGTLLFL